LVDLGNSIDIVVNQEVITYTARRILMELQAAICSRWLNASQVMRLLHMWPTTFRSSRIEAVIMLFDRIVDLHNFYQVQYTNVEPFEIPPNTIAFCVH